jgi:hypothetical protein
MRDQLWRYYPQMLELADDLGADWVLALWELVPTPEKAARVRETTIARVLKKNRVRRFDAAHVLSELRKPALAVAQATIMSEKILRRHRERSAIIARWADEAVRPSPLLERRPAHRSCGSDCQIGSSGQSLIAGSKPTRQGAQRLESSSR